VTAATPVAGTSASEDARFCYLDRMRVLAMLLGLGAAACASDWNPGPGGPYPDGGFGSPGPGFGAPCTLTSDCTGDQVCARDHECLEPAQAHSVLVRWTVGGQPATSTSCAPLGELELQFTAVATGEGVGYAPLMCTEGQFFIDVWPTRYDQVAVETITQTPAYLGSAALAPGNDDVTCDLEPR
jgi:hypothetical protein